MDLERITTDPLVFHDHGFKIIHVEPNNLSNISFDECCSKDLTNINLFNFQNSPHYDHYYYSHFTNKGNEA
jgi:hypothetical protein